jgi:hypothetical protein
LLQALIGGPRTQTILRSARGVAECNCGESVAHFLLQIKISRAPHSPPM